MKNKKAIELLLALLDCDKEMLDLTLHLFTRYEKTFGEDIRQKVIKDLEREYHFEYLILGILIEVLDSINRKFGLDFDILCLEHGETAYEFALEYLSEALDEIGFDPSIRDEVISEFRSWKVTINKKSTLTST